MLCANFPNSDWESTPKDEDSEKNLTSFESFIWNYKTVQSLRSTDEKELIKCLIRSGLLKKPSCAKCGQTMRLKIRQVRSHAWICRKKGKDCSSSSLKNSTIFSNLPTKMIDQVSITVSWLNGGRITDWPSIMVNKKLIYEQLQQLRLECIKYWKNVRLGGKDVIVQLKTFDLKLLGFIDMQNTMDDYNILIAIERRQYGKVYVQLMKNITTRIIRDVINEHLYAESHLVCDQWRNYLVGGLSLDLFSNSANFEVQEAIGVVENGEMENYDELMNIKIENETIDDEANDDEEEEVDFMKISNQLFGNEKQKNEMTTNRSEMESALMAYEIQESTVDSAQPDMNIETPDEFFQFMMMRFESIWKDMTNAEREEVIGENVMRFNGRRDQHKLFWKIMANSR